MLFLLIITLVLHGYILCEENQIFLNVLLNFKNLVENQFNNRINIFQSDSGGEFNLLAFKHHLDSNEIVHQMFCPVS